MTDIELVIKIPEELKRAVDNNEEYRLYTESVGHVMLTAIKNGKPLDNVLDEIKAEIEMEKLEDSPNFFIKAYNDGIERVLRIIDKYKAESDD